MGKIGDYYYATVMDWTGNAGEVTDVTNMMDFGAFEYLYDENGSEQAYYYTLGENIFFGVTFEEFLAK